MIVYCYPKCTTCKKALAFLDKKNLSYELVNIKECPPTKEEIRSWLKWVDVKKLFNTSGLVYRDLNLREKLDSYSLEEQIALLASNGMLIKRPIAVLKDHVLVGFREKEWEDAFSPNKK